VTGNQPLTARVAHAVPYGSAVPALHDIFFVTRGFSSEFLSWVTNSPPSSSWIDGLMDRLYQGLVTATSLLNLSQDAAAPTHQIGHRIVTYALPFPHNCFIFTLAFPPLAFVNFAATYFAKRYQS